MTLPPVLKKTGTGSRVVTLEEAKLQCRVTHRESDAELLRLIDAATEYVSRVARVDLKVLSYTVDLAAWFDCYEIPRWPLTNTPTVEYLSSASYVAYAGYELIQPSDEPAQLIIGPDETQPQPDTDVLYPIRISFDAGFTAATVPETVKQVILLIITHWYDNREASIVGDVPTRLTNSVRNLLELNRLDWGRV